MAFRKHFALQVLATLFEYFDRGENIEQPVPADWHLQPGDQLKYEVGFNASGTAEVVDVKPSENNSVLCTFKKVIN